MKGKLVYSLLLGLVLASPMVMAAEVDTYYGKGPQNMDSMVEEEAYGNGPQNMDSVVDGYENPWGPDKYAYRDNPLNVIIMEERENYEFAAGQNIHTEKRYENRQYGFSTYIPPGFSLVKESPTGARFVDGNGAVLSIYKTENEQLSLHSYMELFDNSQRDSYKYVREGSNWFILHRQKDGMDTYLMHFVSPNQADAVRLSIPIKKGNLAFRTKYLRIFYDVISRFIGNRQF